MPRKFCRKCMTGYNTTYETYEEAGNDKTGQEQFLSGICSDKCWNECSEMEIYNYKFVKPYSFGSTKKIIKVNPKTMEVYEEVDTNRVNLYS